MQRVMVHYQQALKEALESDVEFTRGQTMMTVFNFIGFVLSMAATGTVPTMKLFSFYAREKEKLAGLSPCPKLLGVLHDVHKATQDVSIKADLVDQRLVRLVISFYGDKADPVGEDLCQPYLRLEAMIEGDMLRNFPSWAGTF